MPIIPIAEPSRSIADLLRTSASTPASSGGFRLGSGGTTPRNPVALDNLLTGPQVSGARQSLSRAGLAACISSAFAAQHRYWLRDLAADAGLVLLLSAAGVADLPSGMYLAEVGETVLFTPIGMPCLTSGLPRHPSVASLLVAADLRRVTGLTSIGYPGLLVQVGALAQLLSLAATTSGCTSLVNTASSYETTVAIRRLNRALEHMLTVTIESGGEKHDDTR